MAKPKDFRLIVQDSCAICDYLVKDSEIKGQCSLQDFEIEVLRHKEFVLTKLFRSA